MEQRLFVYGTLAPGKPNEHVMTTIGGTWQEATVNGYLKSQGWGAAMGCPGIVLDAAGEDIKGYIFCSEHLDSHWHELDEFEGEEYERVLVNATTKDNQAVDAYIYKLRES